MCLITCLIMCLITCLITCLIMCLRSKSYIAGLLMFGHATKPDIIMNYPPNSVMITVGRFAVAFSGIVKKSSDWLCCSLLRYSEEVL